MKEQLTQWYLQEKKSVRAISRLLRCSEGKVNYWLKKFGIPKRAISEAVYIAHNPKGDPFLIRKPKNIHEAVLFGLGMGLYWGEGTKKNMHAVRLGNTDPYLVRSFLTFLRKFYSIEISKLRFGIQIFTDMNRRKEEQFWQKFLGVDATQFYKTTTTLSGSIGTYREKSPHGVMTLYFGNKKLRDHLVSEIERMRALR